MLDNLALLAWIALLQTVPLIGVAQAVEDLPPAAPTRPRVVMIASEADSETSQEATLAVQAQLSDVNIELLVEWVPAFAASLSEQHQEMKRISAKHKAIVAFWFDIAPTTQIFLYVAEPGEGRVLVRAVEFEQENAKDRFDVVAMIVRSVAVVIADGGEIGAHHTPEPPPHEAPPAAPEPEPPEEPTESLELSAGYGVSLYHRKPRVLHGARFALGVRTIDWLWLIGAYRVHPSFEEENELVSIQLKSHPFELGCFARIIAGAFNFDLGLAVLNDPLSWELRSKRSDIKSKSQQFRWLVAVSPGAGIGWSPHRLFGFYVATSLDIYLNESHLVVTTPTGEAAVTTPLHVKPYVQVGATLVIY